MGAGWMMYQGAPDGQWLVLYIPSTLSRYAWTWNGNGWRRVRLKVILLWIPTEVGAILWKRHLRNNSLDIFFWLFHTYYLIGHPFCVTPQSSFYEYDWGGINPLPVFSKRTQCAPPSLNLCWSLNLASFGGNQWARGPFVLWPEVGAGRLVYNLRFRSFFPQGIRCVMAVLIFLHPVLVMPQIPSGFVHKIGIRVPAMCRTPL